MSATRDRDGSRRTFTAYRVTYQMATASNTTSMRSRSPRPSPRDTPANPAAMPVAKGFTVLARTPAPLPRSTTATPVRASYPAETNTGTSRG